MITDRGRPAKAAPSSAQQWKERGDGLRRQADLTRRGKEKQRHFRNRNAQQEGRHCGFKQPQRRQRDRARDKRLHRSEAGTPPDESTGTSTITAAMSPVWGATTVVRSAPSTNPAAKIAVP